MATSAWKTLSDACDELPDDGFVDLPKSVQKAVARGDITLDEALERARSGLGDELCPMCGCRTVDSERTGLCGVCHRRRLTEVNLERLAQIQAVRDHDAAKQQVHRARVNKGLPLPRERAVTTELV